ncbi:hypothetical protein [Sphingopyxis sp.]|uniref:hypothetical protein n=1 Tax=Sphingopyxis sp. TaxID=1908224 RepID=UPI003D0B8103
MNEQVEQHVPRGIAEQLGHTDQLPPQEEPPHRRTGVAENAAVFIGRLGPTRAAQQQAPGAG